MHNLQRVLVAGGSSLSSIVKVTIFLTSMSHFPKIVELRRKWFTAPYPADTIVEVAALYSPDAMIEIEAVAIVDAARS
jgi:enamine deaminase RidA (YjgF/YER057c/UK114 family)